MKFTRVPAEQAGGHVLGHHVFHEGRRVLRKGTLVGPSQLEALRASGQRAVYVAIFDASDVGEDQAAEAIADALASHGSGIATTSPHGGRIALQTPLSGVLTIEPERLLELNCLPGVTLATLANHAVVQPRDTVATLKIIPFGLPRSVVDRACGLASDRILAVDPFTPMPVTLLVAGPAEQETGLLPRYREALALRLQPLRVERLVSTYVPLDDEPEAALSLALRRVLGPSTPQLVVVASDTATMDDDDLVPTAIRHAGGEVELVGAPVFPGNLLVFGRLAGATIIGAPGCVRSPGLNVVDLILPRVLAGQDLTRRDLAELGLGGLLHRG